MSRSRAAMAASTRCSPATSGLPKCRPAARCGSLQSSSNPGPMRREMSHKMVAFVATVAVLAVALAATVRAADDATGNPLQAQIEHGKSTYASKCSHCHGPNMMNSGTITPDLRTFPDDKTRFVTTVKNGKNNKMPPWADILSDEEIGNLWAFISSRRKP